MRKLFEWNARNIVRISLGLFFLIGLLLFQAPNSVQLEFASLGSFETIHHPFGCDRLGRDNFAMFAYGSLGTIIVCFPARICTLIFASIFAFLGNIRMARYSLFTDLFSSIFLALPSLLVALVTIAILPDSQFTIIISIVLADWAVSYETMRGKLVEIRKSGFSSASKALGGSSIHVFVFHTLPALASTLEFLFLTGIPSVIMTIALFSYLGINTNLWDLGPGLGEQISFSKDYFNKTPVSVLLPIICVIALVYSFGRDEK